MKYLFPYDKVDSCEKIIIYGYGNVGKSYLEQLNMLDYCEIVAVVDRFAKNIDVRGYRVIEPQNIIMEQFDKIVIAIENRATAQEIQCKLIDSGIESDKIIDMCRRLPEESIKKPHDIKSSFNDDTIHIGIDEGGGLGDAILVLPFLYRIKEIWGSKVEITFISRYSELFDYISCVDYAYQSSRECVFDIFMKNYHIPLIMYWDLEKVQKNATLLYAYIKAVNEFRSYFSRGIDGDKLWHFARLMGKKRYNISDFLGMLKVEEPLGTLINVPANEGQILEKYKLRKKEYLLINRDVDIDSDMCNFKLWSVKQYNELIKKINYKFRLLKIVRVGFRVGKDNIIGLDYDLTGKTSISELLVLLKNAKFLISSEGGLVHLNHFLGGRSVVVYGPTDEKYFGYDNDVICVNRSPCQMPCQYISENTTCPLGFSMPRCMKNVTPQLVYDKIVPMLGK